MLDKRGMTLVESLFAFAIYLNIIILFLSILSQLLMTEDRIKLKIDNLDNKEVLILNTESFQEIIETVLH